MKIDQKYTESEIDQWLNIFDQDIVIEIWESFMIPEPDREDFSEFLESYQRLHLQKYGSYLELKN